MSKEVGAGGRFDIFLDSVKITCKKESKKNNGRNKISRALWQSKGLGEI